ncbi:MAG: hypothetical protein HZA95_00605 [Candidatus Vogelbacteria bacterium]|nr:hypothetical protein [Candidatus Vogelbacteria bacterium]
MNKTILDLLNKERISVLSLILPNGNSHSATMHFSFTPEAFKFYFQTANSSIKVMGLLSGETTKASLVIGTSEVDWSTFQAHGTIHAISDQAELDKIYKIHYLKQPQAEQYKSDPETMFLEFTPTWWRHTDFKVQPETIIEMDNGAIK